MNVENLMRKALSGNISSDELDFFRQTLAKEPELRESLAIEHEMYLYRNQKLKGELRESIPSSSKPKIGFKKLMLLLLLAFGLGAIGYWIYQSRTLEPSISNFADIHLNDKSVSPVKLMGEVVTDVSLWSDAIDKYSNSDYEEALKLISNIEILTEEQKLYMGLCNVYKTSPNYESAGEIMNSLQLSTDNIVYDQALWYGALIDLKLGRLDEAKSQLTIIVESKLWKADEAKVLLDHF